MNPKLMAITAQQFGLFTRQQALESGMTRDHIQRRLRSRQWVTVGYGVYATAPVVDAATTHRERRILADMAASLRIRGPHAWSHHSAAHLAGIPVLREPVPMTHVTRPGIVGSHDRRLVKHHRAPYPASTLRRHRGIVLLDPARTALDITREHGRRQGLVAVDSVLRAGTTRGELSSARSQMRCWPQSTVMDEVLASASPDTDSVGETLARMLVESLGYGPPRVQFGLTADGRTVWCDLCLGRHVFEFDGRVKYLRVDEGGFASTDPDEVLWFEKRRQDFITGFKVGVSRIVWSDCWGVGIEPARIRLNREFRDTCARFGTDASDLAQYRPRGPRPRPRTAVVELGLVA